MLKKSKDDVRFLQFLALFLVCVQIAVIADILIRNKITEQRNNAETVTTAVERDADLFCQIAYDGTKVGYLLDNGNSDEIETGIAYGNSVVSTCSIQNMTDLKAYGVEWQNEIMDLSKEFDNISFTEQMYKNGYIYYILADMPYSLGNVEYTVPFWAICWINPIDDGKAAITTLRCEIASYDPVEQNKMLNEIFGLLEMDCTAEEFLSITDNKTGTVYVPAVHFGYTDAKYFEFDSATGTITEYRSQDKGAPSEVYIPPTLNGITVKAIGDKAFYKYNDANDVSLVVMPDTITEIGDKAFLACTSLKSVTLSGNLEKVGAEVFSGCTALTSIALPETLQKLSAEMFYGCTKLKSVTYSEKLREVYANTFEGCKSLQIQLPETVVIHD